MTEGEINKEEQIEIANLGKLINKKALGASEEELSNNPRSRSAKLRALADKGGEGLFLLRQNEKLTTPTYQSQGKRTAEQKKKIALAPGKKVSSADLEIAKNAELEIKKSRNFLKKLIENVFGTNSS